MLVQARLRNGEAVNHDAHYNPAGGCSMGKTGFCCPPRGYACPNASQTYQGVHGYLASVASVYGAVWTLGERAVSILESVHAG